MTKVLIVEDQKMAQENMELGLLGLTVILLMGNIAFFLLERLLGIMARKLR